MNTLCLEKYGVSEMETREIIEVSGGGPWRRFAFAVVDAFVEAVKWSVDNAEAVYGHEVNNPHSFLK